MTADVFYPIFTLTITILACFIRKKAKLFRDLDTHVHQGIALVWLLKWCKIQSLLLYVFSLKLFIFSLILFVFRHILYIFSLILYIFSLILYIFSLMLYIFNLVLYTFSLNLFIFSQILYIFSLILFAFSPILYLISSYLYSVTSFIYSVSSYFIQSSFLYSVSRTVREDIVPQVLSCSRFRNNQTELRKRQIQKDKNTENRILNSNKKTLEELHSL